MKAIIIVMLSVQVAMLLVAAITVLTSRENAAGRRPALASVAISLVIVSTVSWQIGDRHAGQAGSELLMYGSPLLLGMGLMAVLMLIRRRRGLDGG